MHRDSSGKVRLVAMALMVAAAVLTSGIIATANPPRKVTIPRLPPLHELHPDIYDQDGCVKDGGDGTGRKCGKKEPEKSDLMIAASTSQNLKGFSGRHFAAEVSGTGIAVLEESVGVAVTGSWQAYGLVRNELTQVAGQVSVTATLLDKAGAVLARVTGPVLINELRPGEPGPFAIQAQVPVNEVAKVLWEADASGKNPGHAHEFLIQRFWTEPYTDGQPYRISMGAINLAGKLKNAQMVMAWLNAEGRVIWVETASFSREIKPKGGVYRVFEVTDSNVAPLLTQSTEMAWVVGK